MDQTRVDRYLWAIRLYKTRSDATDACRGGHVELNGRAAKPAASVKVGDRLAVRAQGRPWIIEVTALIDKRVGAPVAARCYIDHSPPAPKPEHVAVAGVRDRGTGRPTKKDRRQLDRFRGSGG